MTGTPNQLEMAELIRTRVDAEFDRVAAAFRSVGEKQSLEKRAGTEAILVILEEFRATVMSRQEAGYFIKNWNEITGQVRQMIFKDARYKEIKARWAAAR